MFAKDTPITILIVDDTDTNILMLERLLSDEGYSVMTAQRGASALELAETSPPDLILLDIGMPAMDGYEVCRRLKADPLLRDIPVIFVSAFSQTEEKVKALSVGGVDYVTKPYQADEVLARIATHLKIRNLQKQLEAKNALLVREIQRRQQVENELKILAATDTLTKIYNRRHFFELASKEHARAKRHQKQLTILIADIDHFKKVNDTWGHLAGDEVLTHFAQLLKRFLRAYDLLGRYGGEEFVILLPDTSVVLGARIADRLRLIIEKTAFSVKGHELNISASFGVSGYHPNEDLPLETILHQADQALYRSKENGRNRVTAWRPSPVNVIHLER
jgi:diguanylate cyclase (GGDEF)-like protein